VQTPRNRKKVPIMENGARYFRFGTKPKMQVKGKKMMI